MCLGRRPGPGRSIERVGSHRRAAFAALQPHGHHSMVLTVDIMVRGTPVRYKTFPSDGRKHPKTIYCVGFVENEAAPERKWPSVRLAADAVEAAVRAKAEAVLSAAGEHQGNIGDRRHAPNLPQSQPSVLAIYSDILPTQFCRFVRCQRTWHCRWCCCCCRCAARSSNPRPDA